MSLLVAVADPGLSFDWAVTVAVVVGEDDDEDDEDDKDKVQTDLNGWGLTHLMTTETMTTETTNPETTKKTTVVVVTPGSTPHLQPLMP